MKFSTFSALSCLLLGFYGTYVSANSGVPVLLFQNEGGHLEFSEARVGHKISTDDFNSILDGVKVLPDVAVIFVQDELSSEDFLRPDKHMRSGGLFKHLKEYSSRVGTFYYPSVKAPYHSLKSMASRYEELIKLTSNDEAVEYVSGVKLQKNTAIVIHLSSTANADNHLSKSLRHNDEIIGKVIQHLDDSGLSYIAAFTAKSHRNKESHEAVVQASGRHLLATETVESEATNISFTYQRENGTCLVYAELINITTTNTTSLPKVDVTCTKTNSSVNSTYPQVIVVFKAPLEIRMVFTKRNGMSELTELTLDGVQVPNYSDLYMDVPVGFSYHCANSFKVTTGKNATATMKGLQIQVFEFPDDKFGDAFDCEGFFTIAIWTGLLLALLLISITVFGLGMLSNISTFDRYDDPRAPQLVVNISE